MHTISLAIATITLGALSGVILIGLLGYWEAGRGERFQRQLKRERERLASYYGGL